MCNEEHIVKRVAWIIPRRDQSSLNVGFASVTYEKSRDFPKPSFLFHFCQSASKL